MGTGKSKFERDLGQSWNLSCPLGYQCIVVAFVYHPPNTNNNEMLEYVNA